MSELVAGRDYHVSHTRKGKFGMRVENVGDEWISGSVVSGVAKAMLDYNRVYVGEPITVRRSFCTFTPMEEAQ